MIIKAAVKYKNKIYTGFDHSECFKQLPGEATMSNIEQGFIDEKNNFFDRKQAMLIAKEMGQFTYETNKQTLISEDLHLNWLNKQAQQITELKQQLETKNKNCLALYSALYETLAKENDENVASQIDFLTKQDNGEINDIYKELQVLKQQLEEKDKEIKSLRTKVFVNSTVNEMLELKLRAQPKEIVEKIRKEFEERLKNTVWNGILVVGKICNMINDALEEILKEYEE